MKKVLVDVKLDSVTFKRCKKRKKTILIQLNQECFSSLKRKDKVLLINQDKDKKIKRKVKKVYYGKDVDELYSVLKQKKKYIFPKNIEETYKKEDIKQYGLIGIELKHNKKIFRKILLGIVLIIFLVWIYYFSGKLIYNYRNNKLRKNLEKIQQEEISYVIVEINPKVLLEIKNKKVVSKGCLNEDCEEIYKDIDITSKSVEEAIELLYNTAEQKGVDVSKGVKVSSTKEEIEEETKALEYVAYTKITSEEEQEYLSLVLDNEQIKEDTKDYNQKLLETYQKDSDYGRLYTCEIKNEKVACYIVEEAVTFPIYKSEGEYLLHMTELLKVKEKRDHVLDKFGIPYVYEDSATLTIQIKGNTYYYYSESSYGKTDCSSGTCKDVGRITYNDIFQMNDDQGGIYMVYFKDLNLLDIDSSKQFYIEQYEDENDVNGWREKLA
jgi:hypothetical protein